MGQLVENFTKNKSKNQYSSLDLKKDFNVLDYYVSSSTFLRVFNENIKDDNFIWHRDEKDRVIHVIYSDKSWMFQFDNQLPFILQKEKEFKVKAGKYHRLLKGKGSLILLIKEN